MILSNDISVVVQGPIHTQDNLTKRVLESVRTHLPDAELILSTWKGSEVEGMDCDVLLLNDDPGELEKQPFSRNLNRQIVSTRNGIMAGKRNFALKLRTDCLLSGAGFLSFFEKFPNRNPKYAVFKNRIITITLFSRNPRRYYMFHPSDITQFGNREDMMLNWDIPLLSQEKEYVVISESYIFIECLKKIRNEAHMYEHKFSINGFRYSENYLINNFVFLEPEVYGVKINDTLKQRISWGVYSQKEWENLYEYYCVKQKEIPDLYSFAEAISFRALLRLSDFRKRLKSAVTRIVVRKLLQKNLTGV